MPLCPIVLKIRNLLLALHRWFSPADSAPSSRAMDLFAGEEPTPSWDGERTDRFRTAVDALDPLTREVLISHCADRLSYRDIALRLDMPVDEVEKRLADALFVVFRAMESGEQ